MDVVQFLKDERDGITWLDVRRETPDLMEIAAFVFGDARTAGQPFQKWFSLSLLQPFQHFISCKTLHVRKNSVDRTSRRNEDQEMYMVRHKNKAGDQAAFLADKMHPSIEVIIQGCFLDQRQPPPASKRAEKVPALQSLGLVPCHSAFFSVSPPLAEDTEHQGHYYSPNSYQCLAKRTLSAKIEDL